MVKTIKYFTILAAAAVIATPAAHAAEFNDTQKAEIEQILNDYLMENGKVIMDAVEAFRLKEQAEQEAQAKEMIKNSKDLLIGENAPSAGNPEASVTVVEFFDYNCGYCKRAVPDIQALIEEDKDVRFVFREMPILGPSSLVAAKWALAAHRQDKYFEYHVALMEHKGEKSEAEMEKIGKDLGLDVEQLKKDANSPEVAADVAADQELARKLGISGTPAFVVGDDLFPGYIGKDGMKGAIDAARKG